MKTIGDILGRYASCLVRIGERRLIALSRKSKRGGQFHKPLVNHAQRLNFRRRTSLDSRFVLPADSWISSVIQGTCQISRDWQLPGAAHDETAHNGDIVVALVNQNDATLKRFYREGDNIRQQPSNVTMKPIIVPAASVEVQGRVIGVLRKY